MKKSELQALGLDDRTIHAIQELHGRAVDRIVKKIRGADSEAVREAIRAMLPLLRDRDGLKRVLREVNYQFHAENRPEREDEKRLPGATNTEQPEETKQSH